MTTIPLTRYFIRLNGELLEVHLLTKPNAENPSVRVRIIRTDSIRRVLATQIITDWEGPTVATTIIIIAFLVIFAAWIANDDMGAY